MDMKTIYNLIFLFLLVAFIGCNNSAESRIEREFLKYVDENFDDPEDFEKITDISLYQKIDIDSLLEMIEECAIDTSSYKKKTGVVINKLESVGIDKIDRDLIGRFMYAAFDYESFISANRHDIEDAMKYIELQNSLRKHSDINIYTYLIKVRLREDGSKRLKKYYGTIYKDDIFINNEFDSKGKVFEEFEKTYKLLLKYTKLSQSYLELYLELKESENKLLREINKINK